MYSVYNANVECQETVGRLRSIIPNINHFATQSPLYFLNMFVIGFYCRNVVSIHVIVSVQQIIKFSYSYPLRCQVWSPTGVRCHLQAVSLYLCFGRIPELLPINNENPYWLSKCSVSIPKSLKPVNIALQLFQSHCRNLVGWVGDVKGLCIHLPFDVFGSPAFLGKSWSSSIAWPASEQLWGIT